MNGVLFSYSFSFLKVIGIIVLFILFLIIAFLLGRFIEHYRNANVIKEARNDAVKRSRAVLGGQLAEQVAPFLPGFPCNAADVRFIGKPVDFIAFPGISRGESVEEVLFIEVKTGSATLSNREREIKKAIENGRVKYVEYRQPLKTK